jgi:hypothetical protein
VRSPCIIAILLALTTASSYTDSKGKGYWFSAHQNLGTRKRYAEYLRDLFIFLIRARARLVDVPVKLTKGQAAAVDDLQAALVREGSTRGNDRAFPNEDLNLEDAGDQEEEEDEEGGDVGQGLKGADKGVPPPPESVALVQRLLVALVQHAREPKENKTFFSAVLCFLALSSVRPNKEFEKPNAITQKLAMVVYACRGAVVLDVVHRNDAGQETQLK